MQSVWAKIDGYFGVSRSGSTLQSELRAGLTTFMAMAYILFVNPQVLSEAIHSPGRSLLPQLMSATAIAAGFGSILMGLIARYPFALGPGMGLNAYFVYTLVGIRATPGRKPWEWFF